MNKTIELSALILMAASVVVLILEAIGKKSIANSTLEKPHIQLFTKASIAAIFFYILFNIDISQSLPKNPNIYLENLAALFLIINTWISLFLAKHTLVKNQSGEIYFLFLASLSISIASVSADTLVVRLVCSCGWLILIASLIAKTIPNGRNAEAALKMTFGALIFCLLFIIAFYCLGFGQSQTSLKGLTLASTSSSTLAYVGMVFFVLSGLCLCGIPPFHLSHIDCADGGNISIAFLLLNNAIIQGSSHLLRAKFILVRSGINESDFKRIVGTALAIGLLILWLRALDQRSIRRTLTYVAATMGPLFCLSLLFGNSSDLPITFYWMGLFVFLTLSLFTLYCALAFMNPINLPQQTWEDLAGFGRKNTMPTLCLLIAIVAIAGLPGTLGYFIKLSLLDPTQVSLIFNGIIFLSIAIGSSCALRIFIFAFSKRAHTEDMTPKNLVPPTILVLTSAALIALGFFPFVH